MKKNSTVYVLQENPSLNFTAALDYGELTYLLPAGGIHAEPNSIVSLLKNKLKGFDPLKDYLLPVGAPFLIGVAFGIVLNRFQEISFLEYDRIESKYKLRKVSIK